MITSDATLPVEPFAAQSSATLEEERGEVSVSLSSELARARSHLAAAAAAVGESLDLEAFVRLAWDAYVDSHPGLREHLATAQLLAQIRELREQGRVGQA
ncbi:MAG: hypothetical protein R3B48_25850 [Kofleriaceae bacterium]